MKLTIISTFGWMSRCFQFYLFVSLSNKFVK
jgi:hypothetical protein